MKSKKEISHPKSRTLQFEKESFLCDNGGHDCGVVYLRRGKWLCTPCLKDAVQKDGANSREAYCATLRAERQMVCRTWVRRMSSVGPMAEMSYEQYRERLDAYLRKQAQKKVLKARRVERKQVASAGGGRAVSALMLKPARKGK